MKMERLTSKLQMALAEAQSLAVGRDHQYIEAVHMLAALLDQQGGTVRHLLSLAQANVNGLRSRLGEELEKLPQVEGTAGDVHLSADMGRLLNVADKLAQQRKDQYISSELFVLACIDDKGKIGDLLRKFGVDKAKLEKAIEQVRGGQKVDDPNAEDQRQ
ncbi:MAG TPA: Clp protease N-terminal domain-containing protein, partial [Gammaproteobacteria bacterium]|nr:Clp protease N-terminal domain-containing protein [Gammaproteobacteria bacterium]